MRGVSRFSRKVAMVFCAVFLLLIGSLFFSGNNFAYGKQGVGEYDHIGDLATDTETAQPNNYGYSSIESDANGNVYHFRYQDGDILVEKYKLNGDTENITLSNGSDNPDISLDLYALSSAWAVGDDGSFYFVSNLMNSAPTVASADGTKTAYALVKYPPNGGAPEFLVPMHTAFGSYNPIDTSINFLISASSINMNISNGRIYVGCIIGSFLGGPKYSGFSMDLNGENREVFTKYAGSGYTPFPSTGLLAKSDGSLLMLVNDKVLQMNGDTISPFFVSPISLPDGAEYTIDRYSTLASDSSGNIYISLNTDSGKILKFDSDGNYLTTIFAHLGENSSIAVSPDSATVYALEFTDDTKIAMYSEIKVCEYNPDILNNDANCIEIDEDPMSNNSEDSFEKTIPLPPSTGILL